MSTRNEILLSIATALGAETPEDGAVNSRNEILLGIAAALGATAEEIEAADTRNEILELIADAAEGYDGGGSAPSAPVAGVYVNGKRVDMSGSTQEVQSSDFGEDWEHCMYNLRFVGEAGSPTRYEIEYYSNGNNSLVAPWAPIETLEFYREYTRDGEDVELLNDLLTYPLGREFVEGSGTYTDLPYAMWIGGKQIVNSSSSVEAVLDQSETMLTVVFHFVFVDSSHLDVTMVVDLEANEVPVPPETLFPVIVRYGAENAAGQLKEELDFAPFG